MKRGLQIFFTAISLFFLYYLVEAIRSVVRFPKF